MKKFVIFLLTALLALSGCKGGDGAELELIKEDILAERFGENLVGVTNEFSILKCKILNCEEDEDEKVLTVRAIAEDDNESVRVTGTYAITYTDQRGEIVEDSFATIDEKITPQKPSDFSKDEFLLALKFLGAEERPEISVIRHTPQLLSGTDRYLVSSGGENFEIEFTYTLKLGWNIRTASLS